jgi:dynein heavy chain
LNTDRIKKVIKFLEQNKSTYSSPFEKLKKDVQQARNEANQNFKYLSTLKELFVDLTDTSKDLLELPDLFVPIMHVIQLIWTYSPHYNTPSRLVVLIREICNAIINQCRNFIDGGKIFGLIQEEDAGEAHTKLTQALDVCSKFKDAYFEYKAKAKNQWKITTNALFMRLDSFSERCQDIMHLTSTIIQFLKL